MDQSAHRRGAFHRVREPDIKRNLRTFPHGANEEQKPNGARPRRRKLGRLFEYFTVG